MKKIVLFSMFVTSTLSGAVKYPHQECQTIRKRKMYVCKVHTSSVRSFCYFRDNSTPLAISVHCEQFKATEATNRKNKEDAKK